YACLHGCPTRARRTPSSRPPDPHIRRAPSPARRGTADARDGAACPRSTAVPGRSPALRIMRRSVPSYVLLSFFRCGGYETVAYSAPRQQMPGALRIVFDVPPQPHDEVVDGPRIGVFMQTPDLFQHAPARDGLAFEADQVAQEVRFHQSQRKDLA